MKDRHWGITILAILGYIGAVLSLIAGLLMIFGAGAIATSLATLVPSMTLLTSLGATFFIIIGIVFIGLAVLDYFIARGLWKGQNWARILTIIFMAIGFISSIWPVNIVGIIISALIIWYLLAYKPAVKYFK